MHIYIYSKSYSDIKEKLTQCKTEKLQTKASSNMRLADWLAIWISSQGTLKSTTQRVYKSHTQNNITPYIGNISLKKLNTNILQDFVKYLELSSATIKTIFTILKSALETAKDRGIH